MRLALLQTKQNALYDFPNASRRFTPFQALKLQKEMIEQNLALLSQTEDADLIVTSEAVNFLSAAGCVDGDDSLLVPTLNDPLFDSFALEAKRKKAYLVVGAYTSENGKLYNSALVFDRQGRRIAVYHKIHLAGSEKNHLAAGDAYEVISADFGRFGVCICWDMQFPEVCRELCLRGAQLVVCPTWGWEGIYAHARAYENGIFVAGAMSVPYWMPIEGLRNPSEVVSPTGDILASGPRDKAAVVACCINLAECGESYALRMRDRRPDTYTLTGRIADGQSTE